MMDTVEFQIAAEKIVSALRAVDENQRLCLMKFGCLSDEQNLRTRRLLLEWDRLLTLVTEAKIDPQSLLPEADWNYLQSTIRAEANVAASRQIKNSALQLFIETGLDASRLPRRKPKPQSVMPLQDWP